MTITQTVDIPESRRLVIDVPREIPTGPIILVFVPKTASENGKRGGFGCAKGEFIIADDFDAPLEDFKDYM
jgi:hypothetical protein